MATSQIDNILSKIEKQIEALESRNAFQDDIIEQLNHELTVHQTEIYELKNQLKSLAQRVKENADTGMGKMGQEPPPPHY